MKTTVLGLCLVVSLLLSSAGYAAKRDNKYEETMNELVAKLYSAPDVNTIQQCKNQLERVHSVYEEEWMPLYYLAFCDIQMTYYQQGSEKNKGILEEAEKYLKELDKKDNIDKSEVFTLWGYFYNAMTLLNPEVNGQAFYSKVVSSYTKAMELNPENPRPVCLLAMYEQYLPDFLQSGRKAIEEKEKAGLLFEKEQPSIDKPYWGALYLNYIK